MASQLQIMTNDYDYDKVVSLQAQIYNLRISAFVPVPTFEIPELRVDLPS